MRGVICEGLYGGLNEYLRYFQRVPSEELCISVSIFSRQMTGLKQWMFLDKKPVCKEVYKLFLYTVKSLFVVCLVELCCLDFAALF